MKYKTFRCFGDAVPDLVIEKDGETWIRVDQENNYWSGLWPGIAYERLEVVRAKDYDPARGTDERSARWSGGAYSRDSYAGAGSYHYFVDESGIYEPEPSAPLIQEILWENSITNPVKGKDDGIRTWPEWNV